MTSVSRGDVVWVTFPEPDDIPEEEFDNPHPSIVVQNDTKNHRLDTTVVIPLSTSQSTAEAFSDVELSSDAEEVEDDCVAKLEMITTVSVPGRIMEQSTNPQVWKMGEVSASKLNEIESKLELVLGLN